MPLQSFPLKATAFEGSLIYCVLKQRSVYFIDLRPLIIHVDHNHCFIGPHWNTLRSLHKNPGIEIFVIYGPQKFSVVRKEDAGEYYCRARNEAGFSECAPQMMEVCKYFRLFSTYEDTSQSLWSHDVTCFFRWHEHRWNHLGCAGCGGGTVVYNSGHLLCL